MESTTDFDDPRFHAVVDVIGRTGAESFRIGFTDEDEPPVIWHATASYKRGGEVAHEADAAMSPLKAVLRLAERLIDGAVCTHCHRPCGLEPDSIAEMPLGEHICWYQYDPELKKFRRGCEGDTEEKA